MTATGPILATDRFGRRLVVFAASILCSLALLLVGVLGQVGHTKPLQDFLIFVACLWALGKNARESSPRCIPICPTLGANNTESDNSAGPSSAG